LRAWKLVAVLMMVLFCFARFAPSYALSGISVSPTSVATGGTVTITINMIALGPDHFTALTVTDPLGNVFSYSGSFTLTTTSPTMAITFPLVTLPDTSTWTLVSGPGGNTGTGVSGMYSVSGTYLDAGAAKLLGIKFLVQHDQGSFGVPEFNQSILLLVGVMIPAIALIRLRMSPKQPIRT
jgi:hypothetical protein